MNNSTLKVKGFSSPFMFCLRVSLVYTFGALLYKFLAFPFIDWLWKLNFYWDLPGWWVLIKYLFGVYIGLAWLICWVGNNTIWFVPFLVVSFTISFLKSRRALNWQASRKIVMFQARKLGKTYKDGSFGKDELSAFLNAVHLACCLGISARQIVDWLWEAFDALNNTSLDVLLHDSSFVIQFDDGLIPDEGGFLPKLLISGELAEVR